MARAEEEEEEMGDGEGEGKREEERLYYSMASSGSQTLLPRLRTGSSRMLSQLPRPCSITPTRSLASSTAVHLTPGQLTGLGLVTSRYLSQQSWRNLSVSEGEREEGKERVLTFSVPPCWLGGRQPVPSALLL